MFPSSFLENAQAMDGATMLENLQFLNTVYDLRVLLLGFLLLFSLDFVLKLVGMWRAARLGSWGWFLALFFTSSFGVLPLFFLSLTRRRYRAMQEGLEPSRGGNMNAGKTG